MSRPSPRAAARRRQRSRFHAGIGAPVVVDGATHFIVPYAAALLALGAWRSQAPARRVTLAVAFGLGGWAPDADVATDWLSERFDALYFLQHRGFSHSLLGAPVHGALLAALLALAARAWGRLGRFAFSWTTIGVAAAGALTHLVLDGVTYGGVPLLWPFVGGRLMWPVFNWLVVWLFPVGAVAIVLHVVWRRIDRRMMLALGAATVVVLLAVAGARLAARPDAPEGGYVYPRNAHDEWVLVAPVEGGWRATLLREGAAAMDATYLTEVPPSAHDAVASARAHDAYKGFQMGLFGPEVVQARPLEGQPGAWNVTFLAVVQRFEAEDDPRWSPAKEDHQWGMAAFHVGADGAVTPVVRGW